MPIRLMMLLTLVCACVVGCSDSGNSSSQSADSAATPTSPPRPPRQYFIRNKGEINLTHDLQAVIETNRGPINITLYATKAPITVASFANLAERGYFNGLTFHRVVPDFVIQGGDPTGTGRGGPGYRFEDELRPDVKHESAGTLSMANAGPNTNGSQFFVTHRATPHLDMKHTVFGKVNGDADQKVVNAIRVGDEIKTVRIVGDTAELHEKAADLIAQFNAALEENGFPAK